MRLDISSLIGRKGAFFQVKRELPGDFVEAVPDVDQVKGPLMVELMVTNTGEGYLVAGDVSLEVQFRCSRCLKPLIQTITGSFEEEFLNHPSSEDDESQWDEESLIEGDELDASSVIEESVLINMPMKVVCSSNCPGLCPTCGAVLAEGDCDCEDPDVDIRLAPLSKLLKTSETTTSERRKDHGSTKEKTFKSEG